MVKLYHSLFPDIDIPKTGLIPYLFENPYGIPESKPLFIDVHTEEIRTFGQIKDDVLRLAAGLQDMYGFGQGDVLALFAPNSVDFVLPALGAIAAGGVTSPSNPRYSVTELVHQLQVSDAKILIAHPENIQVALEAAQVVGMPKRNLLVLGTTSMHGVLPFTVLLQARRATVAPLTAEEAQSRPCYLCFSSGTTGKAKGVMTSHTNAIAGTALFMTLEDHNDPTINQRHGLNFLPMFHMYALLIVLHLSLRRGTAVDLMAQFDMDVFLNTVQKRRITHAWLVPPVILALAKYPQLKTFDLTSLIHVFSAAAPLSKEVSEAFAAQFPTVYLSQGYGMTETFPIATIELLNDTAHGSCGVLVPNMVARLVKEDGSDAQPNEPGELWLKGPNIMLGYMKNEQATAETIDADQFLHTGDVAVIDDKERFYIVDRIKELIKYKGFQVAPAELEGILLKSSLVSDCAVIGVYDPVQATELPHAFVVLKSPIDAHYLNDTAKTLMAFVANQVASFKQIRHVRFVDTIPKTASGKILRRVLRDHVKQELSMPPAKL
ncbi:unnamed protein product [Absidia cylindrospora]